MNKNLVIAFLIGIILTLIAVNYLPKFNIKIEVAEEKEIVEETADKKINKIEEISDEISLIDRLKNKFIPEPIPEITADEFLLKNFPDTRVVYPQPVKQNISNNQEGKNTKRNKPPKASRTRTMSKEVGAEFIKSQKALQDNKHELAMNILNNLLEKDDLRLYERATIIRLQAYIFAELEDYDKTIDYLKWSLSFNALNPQAQRDLKFQIAQLYLALEEWGNGLYELLEWVEKYEKSPKLNINAILAQIYTNFASMSETGSLAEKQFYEKAEPYAKKSLSTGLFKESWYQVYLSILLFNDRYEEALPLLEKLFQELPEKELYKRQLSILYGTLDMNDGLIPPDISSLDKESLKPDFLVGPGNASVAISTDEKNFIIPILKFPARYPQRALTQGIEGWVLIEFSVSKLGTVVNPRVIDSEPPEIFDNAALRAVHQWQYKPMIVDGKTVSRDKIQHLITFELNN